jgi:hypothetical protein
MYFLKANVDCSTNQFEMENKNKIPCSSIKNVSINHLMRLSLTYLNKTPPIGAPKAAATPAATPELTK